MKILKCKIYEHIVHDKNSTIKIKEFLKEKLLFSDKTCNKLEELEFNEPIYIELYKEIQILDLLEKKSIVNKYKLIPWKIYEASKEGITLIVIHFGFGQKTIFIPMDNIVAIHTITPQNIIEMDSYEKDLKEKNE